MNINDLSEEEQIKAVANYPIIIKDIDNPSEKVQLYAIKRNPHNIQYIKNPTEKVKLKAVRKFGLVIAFIKDPSEEGQIEAVKSIQNIIHLHYIEDINGIVKRNITSPKALELYEKFNIVRRIIK
jgi:hypothetical protein